MVKAIGDHKLYNVMYLGAGGIRRVFSGCGCSLIETVCTNIVCFTVAIMAATEEAFVDAGGLQAVLS